MRLLEYADLDTRGVTASYAKFAAAIARDDFRSADVRKLANITHGAFYRARLDRADRVLLTFVRRGDETCAVALEVIRHHDYAGSRFLRGALIDEDRIAAAALPQVTASDVAQAATPTRFLHSSDVRVFMLDKPLSFDDAQAAVFAAPLPLVVVGSAGSGKTALALERLKRMPGDVLYITRSPYLARTAQEQYFAHFENEEQNASFLSMREFLESIHVPPGREAMWHDFAGWFVRQRQTFRGVDAHQAFEEIRGVLLAAPEGVLTREAYLGLGVRQSIFLEERREQLYDLFERYRRWLADSGLYDAGLLTQDYADRVQPSVDAMVIDEVQDFTAAQVALLLRALREPQAYLLCGDSNQVVHPNFFAWSRLTSLLQGRHVGADCRAGAREPAISVLHANYRSGTEPTRIANALLRIKQRRFGSIDQESNYLVEAVGDIAGSVVLLADDAAPVRQLNERTRGSVNVAVLVLRDEDKEEARRTFATPLVFSAQEAKGLEYDSVILHRFVSGEDAVYRQIAAGVTADDIREGGELAWRRVADKTDKSLEIYKFHVNALYVAITRARLNVIIVERDASHALLQLLAVRPGESPMAGVAMERSSREDWRREAHRLEQQGKLEQAAAIRNTVLRDARVPWPVFDAPRLRELLARVFVQKVPGNKPRDQLREFAAAHYFVDLERQLAGATTVSLVRHAGNAGGAARYLGDFGKRNFKDVLQRCDQHGVDHLTPMGTTPLMNAAAMGNVALVDALLDRGADIEARDLLRRQALHHALQRVRHDRDYAQGAFAEVYARVAPARLDFAIDGRLVRIDRAKSEYLLLQWMWLLQPEGLGDVSEGVRPGFSAPFLESAMARLPDAVTPQRRRTRTHVSAVLSRNEVDRDYAYNRRLFVRHGAGRYQWNPAMSMRDGDGEWQPVLVAQDLPLLFELLSPDALGLARDIWRGSGQPDLPDPLRFQALLATLRERQAELHRARAAEVDLERRLAEKQASHREATQRAVDARLEAERPAAAGIVLPPAREKPPTREQLAPWGTRAAKMQARREVAERIERLRAEKAARQMGADTTAQGPVGQGPAQEGKVAGRRIEQDGGDD